MSARRGVGPWLTTGTVIGLTVVLVGWPAWWSYAAVFAAGGLTATLGSLLEHRPPIHACPGYETTPNTCTCPCEGCRYNCAAHLGPTTQECAGCAGCGGPDCLELTADDARQVAADLGIELYRAQDAIAFVGEMCDIADRQGRSVTTAQVRAWLGGPQCARQTGLVLPSDTRGERP